MIILDASLLAHFRRRPCEVCGRSAPSHASHLFTKGMGGSNQMDIEINLNSLCWECHGLHHAGHQPTFDDLLALISTREQMPSEAILAQLYAIKARNGKVTVGKNDGGFDHPDYQGRGEDVFGDGVMPRPEHWFPRFPTDSGDCAF